ncbi:MAG: SMI1/KNR4 family protein [Gemmataceae bacterium]
MADSSFTRDSWQRIEEFLRSNHPEIHHSLQGPATEEAIAELEQVVGQTLPNDFKELWRIHDGQDDDFGEGIFPDLSSEDWPEPPFLLMSVEMIQQDWSILKALNAEGNFDDVRRRPPPEIQKEFWHQGWIPIGHNGAGDHYCLDMAPTEKGKVGQIIIYYNDGPDPILVAPSLADWLHDLANGLESGKFRLEEDE